MNRPAQWNELDWADFTEHPDSHLGPADRGLIAAIIRRQHARIRDLEARQRSARAAISSLEMELRDIAEKGLS